MFIMSHNPAYEHEELYDNKKLMISEKNLTATTYTYKKDYPTHNVHYE